MPNFIVANWIILTVRISNRGFNSNVSTKTQIFLGRVTTGRVRCGTDGVCDVVRCRSGGLSTDGDAADAGGLDARHGERWRCSSERAHGRRRRGTARWHCGHSRRRYSARTKYSVRSGRGVWPGAPLAIWSGTEREAAAGGGRQRARAPGIRLWQGGGAAPGS